MRLLSQSYWLGLSLITLGGCASTTAPSSQEDARAQAALEAHFQVKGLAYPWVEASLKGLSVHLKAERACALKEPQQQEAASQFNGDEDEVRAQLLLFERCEKPQPYPHLGVTLVSTIHTPMGVEEVRIDWGKTNAKGEFTGLLSNLDWADLGYPNPFDLHLEFHVAQRRIAPRERLDTSALWDFLRGSEDEGEGEDEVPARSFDSEEGEYSGGKP